ncbi:hypothetical protein ACFL1R_03170 [Candidatus Latescibacterota bacterium]
MSQTSRREMLRTGAALGAGIAAGVITNTVPTEAHPIKKNTCKWENEYTFGHTVLFMEEYHLGTMEILGRLSGELDHIGELSSRAAHVIKSGGTVWASINVGHMPGSETKETRRGNSGVMKDHKGFDELKKGDMVFTNSCNKAVQAARDRGVYVVCVTVNYINNEFRPAGFTNPNEDDLLLKDVSNDILHSHVPYYQGLVHAPEIPEITICPSTSTGSGTVYWMLNAETANKLADKSAKEVDKSAEYIRILTERVERVKEHMDRIREVAVTMARRIRDGGTWFVRSLEHPGLASELHYVECGPMIVNLGNWDLSREKNVILTNGISPAYPDEIKLALEKQVEGAYVIGIGPDSLDGEEVYGRLIDVADAGFDNFSPESGGVITIKGRKDTICPTSGIVGNVIQQMICAQWTDEMVRRGSVPYYFKGVCQIGGREYINVMKPLFDKQGF